MLGPKSLLLVSVLVAFLVEVAQANYCPDLLCDVDEYCCGYNLCCDQDVAVYSLWWFWFIWVIVIVILASCGFWCRARMRARQTTTTYLVVPNAPPQYGAVVTPATVTTVTNSSAPHAPPGYTNQPAPQYQERKP